MIDNNIGSELQTINLLSMASLVAVGVKQYRT